MLSPGLAKSQPRECQGLLGFGGNEAQAGMWELWGTWDVTSFARALLWEVGLHKPGAAHPGWDTWSRSQQRG